jgi:hypothetical protein
LEKKVLKYVFYENTNEEGLSLTCREKKEISRMILKVGE